MGFPQPLQEDRLDFAYSATTVAADDDIGMSGERESEWNREIRVCGERRERRGKEALSIKRGNSLLWGEV